MLKKTNGIYTKSDRWRSYQSRLQRLDELRRTRRRIPGYIFLLFTLILVNYGIFHLLDLTLTTSQPRYSLLFSNGDETVDKTVLKKIFRLIHCENSLNKEFTIKSGGETYLIATSLDPTLQGLIINNIDRKNSRYFGFVAMEPDTGRVLSMVSYDRLNRVDSVCTLSDFPAASLFKIVTAAAAMEQGGYNRNTTVTFNGDKYTLYKSQLKDTRNRYTRRISFMKAFADSVNPVFGKIGAKHLGKSTIESYARAFGFNRSFDCEIPIKPSRVTINDNPYNWAEVACGFNHKTMISPLHAALIMSAILNNGRLMEPTVIDQVSREEKTLYQRRSHEMRPVIEASTAKKLQSLLNATVSFGTASKSFRGRKRDRILSKLNIGGKTGSINNDNSHIKYDWFAGFAREKNGPKKIVVSVLVVHQDFIGTRAARYSRMAIKDYFRYYYAASKNS